MRVGADRGAVPATLGPAIGFDPHGCGLVREQAERRTQKPPFLKKVTNAKDIWHVIHCKTPPFLTMSKTIISAKTK